jgi:hypothetical protein
MAIRRMRIPFWILKATNTTSEYVIFTASPLQQWLDQRKSKLHYTLTVLLRFVARILA